MRKPIEVRSDADLQAIQTSVAFKNISDAIEQYRRQFGLAFLALIAFSAIHVGLVVIANLYTLETRVENGVLTAAKSTSVSTPTPVATATLEHNYGLDYIMSNVEGAEQKKMISSIKSVDFIDHEGNYRQYTVTGFKLSGFKNSELSLFTSVGHVLEFVRGKGLRVVSEGQSCNCTSDKGPGRKLLQSKAIQAANKRGYGDHVTDKAVCIDAATVTFARQSGRYVGSKGEVNIPFDVMESYGNAVRECVFMEWGGVGYSLDGNANDYQSALAKHMELATQAAASATAIMTQMKDEILSQQAFWSRSRYRGEGLDWNDWDNSVCMLSKFEGNGGEDYSCPILEMDDIVGTDTMLITVDGMEDHETLEAFMSNFDTTCKGKFVKDEFAAFVTMYVGSAGSGDDASAGKQTRVGQWLDNAIGNVAGNAEALNNILKQYTLSSGSWKARTLYNLVRDIVYSQAGVGMLDNDGQLSRAGFQYDPEFGWMDPRKLRTEQQLFYSGWSLAWSLWSDLQARVDREAQACAEHNAANFAIIGMTFVNTALHYIGSDSWRSDVTEAFESAWESTQIIASQQSTKCAAAASECFGWTNRAALGALCEQGVEAAGSTEGDCSLVSAGKKAVYSIDGSYTLQLLADCGRPGSRAHGCTTEPLFEMYLNLAELDFTDVQEAATLSEALGDNALSKYSGWVSDLIAKDGRDTVAIVMGWIDSFINTKVSTIISDALGEWEKLKSTNMWDNGKTIHGGVTVARPEGYGCSSTAVEMLSAFDTMIPVVAIAACQVESGNTHKLPMVNGAMFSAILGGYDAYSIYVPPKMCAMVNTAMDYDVSRQMDAISANLAQGTSSNGLVDYVIMLHGWGGTNAWMNTISLVFNYGMNGKHGWSTIVRDFDVCVTSADMAVRDRCVSHVAPGGFAIMAPNGGSVPVGCRHWWFNSEFSGFLLDYVVFDLPANFLQMTGVDGRTASVFGFSMGGWGVLLVLNTFPKLVAAAAAYNAPLYPASCFFAYICHHACVTDPIYCEILFTTMGMVINSYVIVFQDGSVTSGGSMDPMGMGVAVQFAKSPSGAKIIECRKSTTDAQIAVERFDELSWTGVYAGVADITMGVTQDCSYQDWTSVEAHGSECQAMFSEPSANSAEYSNYYGKSVHVNIPAMGRDVSNYKCQSCDYSEATKQFDDDKIVQGADMYNGVFGFGRSNGEEPNCPMSMCAEYDWCSEPNDAEDTRDSSKYLNPVFLTVATMKFVPQSNAITESAVPSAFKEVYYASPATKFMNSAAGVSSAADAMLMRGSMSTVSSMYGVSTVMLYLHCAQNDEAGNYQQHIVYAGMILGAASADGNEHWVESSQFLIDFEDCDGHFYSERDIRSTLMWLSDALRSFVGDIAGDEDFNVIRDDFLSEGSVKRFDYLKTCWLSMVGDGSAAHFGGSYASSFVDARGNVVTITAAGRGCTILGHHSIHAGKGAATQGVYPSVYTEEEWKAIEGGNQVHVEATHVIQLMRESSVILADWAAREYTSCEADLSSNDLFSAGQSRATGKNAGDSIGSGPTQNLCAGEFDTWTDDDGVSHSSEKPCMGIGCTSSWGASGW
jgi:pimeloyl-ACP methyl ester carboxylesterase